MNRRKGVDKIPLIEGDPSGSLESQVKQEADGCAARLFNLRGIGPISGWRLDNEFFAWREFKNRREVGGMAGLCGTPYNSGAMTREQGISKAGNRRVRTRMVELSWLWLRHNPHSRLSQWYMRRFADSGKRMRRVGIVALSRRLLIELWHFVEHGVVPLGARIKFAD